MPKIRKVKRRKTYKANINRKRLRNKLRKLPDIGCKDVKAAWENTLSTRQNLGDMGLAYDPNELLKIPNSKRELVEAARQIRGVSAESDDEKNVKRVPSKTHVAQSLEADAKAPRERLFRLPNQQVQFVTYLMDKYADDYKAMARDKKNYYQMTWRQIRAKINTFKGIPEQYAEYLVKKGDIVLEDPTTLEETRKRIAEENVKKCCAPKPKKVKKKAESRWLVESDEEMDFDNGDKLADASDDETNKSGNPNREHQKKLKLFSDDEDDDRKHESGGLEPKKSKANLKAQKNGKITKNSAKIDVRTNINRGSVVEPDGRTKNVEISLSSDSESDVELEDDDVEGGFVDLNDLSEEQLSDDDVLDNGEFATDSDDSA